MSPARKSTPDRGQIATTGNSRRARRTSTTTEAFFDELASRGHEPLLRRATGTARFDLVDGSRTERWLLAIKKGEIAVSRRNAHADCVLRADKAAFDRLVAGKQNMVAAVLRGDAALMGDMKLLVLVQRLFPRPSRRRAQRARPGSARRKR